MTHGNESAMPTTDVDGHRHPVPLYVHVLLALFGIGILLLGYALRLDVARDAQTAAERAERVTAEVKAELDRRTVARNVETARIEAEQQQQAARTRRAVCIVLTSGDLGDSPRIVALAQELQCTP